MTTAGPTAPGALPATTGTALDLDQLLGIWHATDQHTPGVTRLELTGTDGVLVISARGADEPQPRDWGTAEATAYGADPGSDKAMAFTASYDFGFLTILLAAYAKQGILVLDTFTSFHDGTGRSDYFTREFFHR